MRFSYQPKTQLGLDAIALTDIIMNLFIFFFITFNLFSTFQSKPESSMKINLPEVHQGLKTKKVDSDLIRLTRSGNIYWNDSHVSIAGLGKALRSRQNRSKPIRLRADRKANVQSLTSILEVAHLSGASNLSLQTELTVD